MKALRIALALCAAATASTVAACADNDVGTHTTALVQYQSCTALEADLRSVIAQEMESMIDQMSDPNRGWGGEDAADGGGSPPPSGDGREEGVDYSGTNNQEGGVDEADFLKTDGFHIYTINGNRLHVFAVPTFGELVPLSTTELEGRPREMLLDGDKVAVFSMIDVQGLPEDHPLRAVVRVPNETEWYWRTTQVSKLTVLDLTDRTAPRLVKELYLEGWYQTAREVDGSVRLAAYSLINGYWSWWRFWDAANGNPYVAKWLVRQWVNTVSLDELLPNLYQRTPDGALVARSFTGNACRSFYRPSDSHGRGVTSILSVDLRDPELRVDSDHVVTNYSQVYASTDTLVLTEPAHDWWWFYWNQRRPDLLNIHTFDISQPGVSRYLASGRVEGWVPDQFAIDEEAGRIRIATTTDMWRRWWLDDEDDAQPPSESHVWVLERQGQRLTTVGHLGGLGVGERLFAARFEPDRAYLVTFRQTDPLYTIDLSSPTEPRVAGELEIPGFSTYLHPVAEGKLLSVGVGGDENGANWRTQISIFDVSDMSAPTQQDVEVLANEDGWGWSEALWEHKAFQYWAPKQLLSVPMSSYVDEFDGTTWRYRYLSRLELITVDLTAGLSRHGTIDHSAYYNADPDHWWLNRDIRRTIFMGDFIYAVSDLAITVHRASDLGQVTAQPLPGFDPEDYYWWW
jgi:hypothetical protein